LKRFLLVLLLAGAAYAAYWHFVLQPPVRAYRHFADAWAREGTPAAAALTTGDTAKKDVESRILRGVVLVPMEAFRGTRHEIEKREGAPDGTVVVTAKEFVFYDPPGVTTGIGGAGVAAVRHVAQMKKTDDGWRVVAWTPEFLGAHPRRPER
jgi:hypothetical protein